MYVYNFKFFLFFDLFDIFCKFKNIDAMHGYLLALVIIVK